MSPGASQAILPSGGIRVAKRWLQTVIKRGNKNQNSHQPDGISRDPGRAANPRSRSNSPAAGNTSNERPSWMAAGQRVRVSVLFFCRQMVRGVSDETISASGRKARSTCSSNRLFNLLLGVVVYSASQSKTKTKTTRASHLNKAASGSGQGRADTKKAGPVRLPRGASFDAS